MPFEKADYDAATAIMLTRGWILRPAADEWELWIFTGGKPKRIVGPQADWPQMVLDHEASLTGAVVAKKARQAATALNWFYGAGVNRTVPPPAQLINRPYELRVDAVGPQLPEDLRYSMWRRVNTNRNNDVKSTGDHESRLGAIEELMDNLGLTYTILGAPE